MIEAPSYRGLTLAEKIARNTGNLRDEHRANLPDVMREIEASKTIAAGAQATSRMPDTELRKLATRRAWLMQQRTDDLAGGMTSAGLLDWLNAGVEPLQGKPFAFEGKDPTAEQVKGFVERARCNLWWRRQLRRAAVRARETEANAAGEVNARKRTPYVTHDTAKRHALRSASNADMMAATQMENDAGQVMSLADLAATSTSNKAIRRGELMTRITGCEKWSEAFGMRGVFLTLTAPSRFHAVHRHGGKNERHDGSTPRDAQQWLCQRWAWARAKLKRAGVALYGFRVAEPHHDGCPHWHALLWAAPGQLWRAVRIIKRAWLRLEGPFSGRMERLPPRYKGDESVRRAWSAGLEPGARHYRAQAKAMAPGGAAGYIAKYIAKNIDDEGAVGTDGHTDDDYSAAVPVPAQADAFGGTAQRVVAWASAWGIRQFQAIGQPPVTVWRELRRITEQGGATSRLVRALDAVSRDGDKRASWAAYVLEQGGMNTGRNYLLRIVMQDRIKVGRYGSGEVPCVIGVRDTTGPGDVQTSSRREWRPRGEWTEVDKVRGPWAPRGLPWTRVNNCTRQRPGERLSTWLEIVNQGPGAGHNEEPPPCTATPPPSQPNWQSNQTTSERLSCLRALRTPSHCQPNSSPPLRRH